MKMSQRSRSLFITLVSLAVSASLLAAQPATFESSQLSPALAKVLADIRAHDKDQLSVAEEDGRFLRMLVASTGRKRALEIGSAFGYSAIWIGLGLRDTGGKLVTIEIDPARAKERRTTSRRRDSRTS